MTDGFYSRLARAQSKFGEAQLDEENRYDRYKYPSFGSVIKAARGPLTEEGIAIIQELLEDDNREIAIGVHTILKADDGEHSFGTVWLQPEGRAVKDGKGTTAPPDIKAIGSAITYAKRYGLELALGIGREDVDSVDQQPERPPARQQRPPTRRPAGPHGRTSEPAATRPRRSPATATCLKTPRLHRCPTAASAKRRKSGLRPSTRITLASWQWA